MTIGTTGTGADAGDAYRAPSRPPIAISEGEYLSAHVVGVVDAGLTIAVVTPVFHVAADSNGRLTKRSQRGEPVAECSRTVTDCCDGEGCWSVDAASSTPTTHNDHSDSRPGTAGRFCAAFALVVALVSGCSSSGSGVLTQDLTSASSSSASAPSSVVPVTASPSAGTSSAPTSASAVSPFTAATPTSNPWPADLTPEQQDQAKAALAALDGYIKVTNAASADPAAKDWTADVRKYTADPAATQFLESVASFVAAGVHQVSPPIYESPTVTSVVGKKVSIQACVDRSEQSIVDSVGAPALQPPANPKSLWTANVDQYDTPNGWLVSETLPTKPPQPC